MPELKNSELKNKLELTPELNQRELKNKLALGPELKNKLALSALLNQRLLNHRSLLTPELNHKELKNKLGSVWLLKNNELNQSWFMTWLSKLEPSPKLDPTRALFSNEETVKPPFWTLSWGLLLVNAIPPILKLKIRTIITAVTVFKILANFAIVLVFTLKIIYL